MKAYVVQVSRFALPGSREWEPNVSVACVSLDRGRADGRAEELNDGFSQSGEDAEAEVVETELLAGEGA